MGKTYRRKPKSIFRKPKTRREFIDNLSLKEELEEFGYEPDNRTRQKASAPTVDEYDDIFHAALEEKHNLV
jgi:hypothetical protein